MINVYLLILTNFKGRGLDLSTSSNANNSYSWARLQSGARDPFQISQVDGRHLALLAVGWHVAQAPGHHLLPPRCVSREQDQKWQCWAAGGTPLRTMRAFQGRHIIRGDEECVG